MPFAEGIPLMNAQIVRYERIYLQENTLYVRDEYYDFGRRMIELVDDFLYDRKTAREAHDYARDLYADAELPSRSGIIHESHIVNHYSRITRALWDAWQERTEDYEERLLEAQAGLQALLDRPRRTE